MTPFEFRNTQVTGYSACLSVDTPDFRLVRAKNLGTDDVLCTLATWGGGLAFTGKTASFLMTAPVVSFWNFDALRNFQNFRLPEIQPFVRTPVRSDALEWGCHAICWVMAEINGAGAAGGVRRGGGPAGMRR